MMSTAATVREAFPHSLREAIDRLEIALPAPTESLDQDEEWVIVRHDGEWRRIRLHDYSDVFAVQGLYEKWVYEVLRCSSPAMIGALLRRLMRASGRRAPELTALDLGAGNGCVAEELRAAGVKRIVGVDIHDEARDAAERDRPGLYDDYVVGDLTSLDKSQSGILDRYNFNALTCVAALGFGDIPPAVFAEAFNRIETGGLIAFTIKTDFLDENDRSGFSILIRRLISEKALSLAERERYTHRITADGQALEYEAFIGIKRADIRSEWIVDA